jgi:uncharacterized protein YbbC (DUF1343 family)
VSARTGLDALIESGYAPLRGRNVAVLCHHASVDGGYRHIAFRLREGAERAGFRLVCAFSPEHGLWGAKDSRIEGSNVDRPTGLVTHSLYGQTNRPSKQMLEGVDTLVMDLQDVGARFYTYTWTMAHCLAACEEFGVQAVILDRPNPIGGAQAEGPVLEPAFSSFVGLHPVAQRHGMTFGELAGWIRARFHPKLDLEVVRCRGWKRADYFETTKLPWIPPSPNMPRVETAVVYPGICLFEGTNLSEGRGTTRPFETFGHPALDGWKLAERLNRLRLPGARFRPAFYQPTWNKHAGKGCGGCYLDVTDRAAFDSVAAGLAVLATIQEMAPEALGWDDESKRRRFDRLAGCSWLRESLGAGEPLHAIRERIESSSKAFLDERASMLLY